MAMDAPIPPGSGDDFSEWFRWVVAAIFGTMGVVLGWLQMQINQVRKDAHKDKEDVRRELLEAINALREANNIQHTALKDDVKDLRDVIEKNREEASVERRRTIDALGQLIARQAALPDRNEMQTAISSLRLDVATLLRVVKDGNTTG